MNPSTIQRISIHNTTKLSNGNIKRYPKQYYSFQSTFTPFSASLKFCSIHIPKLSISVPLTITFLELLKNKREYSRLSNKKKEIILEHFSCNLFRMHNLKPDRELSLKKNAKILALSQATSMFQQVNKTKSPNSKMQPFQAQLDYISSVLPRKELHLLSQSLDISREKIKRFLVRKLIDWDRNAPISKSQRDTCRDILKKKAAFQSIDISNLKLTSDDYTELQAACKLDRYRVIRLVTQLKDPSRKLSSSKVEKIKIWMRHFPNLNPTQEDIKDLSYQLQLGMNQIRFLIWYYKQKKGIITKEKKQVIRNYILEKGNDNLSTDIERLQEETKLSRIQVRSLIWRFSKEISAKSIKIDNLEMRPIQDFLKNSMNEKDFFETPRLSSISTEKVEELSHKLGIPPGNLRHVLNKELERMKRGHINDSIKEDISQWFSIHGSPRKEQVEMLAKRFRLSPLQVRNLYRQYTDPPQELTDQKKYMIKEWIEANKRRPTSKEYTQLKEELQISSAQLSKLITRYLHPRKKITEEMRNTLKIWLENRNYTRPSDEDLKNCQLEVSLPIRQLREEISKLMKAPVN